MESYFQQIQNNYEVTSNERLFVESQQLVDNEHEKAIMKPRKESRFGEQIRNHDSQNELTNFESMKKVNEAQYDQLKKEYDEKFEAKVNLEREKLRLEFQEMICKTFPRISSSEELIEQNFKLQRENELLKKQNEELNMQVDELKKVLLKGPLLESLEDKLETTKKVVLPKLKKTVSEIESSEQADLSSELKIQILLEKIEDETQARSNAEELAMKLQDELIEANIRIEEWKHHFLIETQERAQMDNERKEMQQELERLKKKIGLLLKNQQNS